MLVRHRLAGLLPAALLPFALALGLSAQSPLPEAQPPSVPTLTRMPLVPLHTHPDDPVFGPYGIRAGGPGYLASFSETEVEVTAILGPDAPDRCSITWRTERIEIGGIAIAGDNIASGAPPRGRIVTPTRYEVQRGPVVEAWDVRADGTEQTFTIARRPELAGDLVVRGRLIGMNVEATAPFAEHAAIEWRDGSGKTVLRYGTAVLVDANGVRTRIVTTWSGEEVLLTVPEATLHRARFPITIDPLLSGLTTGQLSFDVPVPEVAPSTGSRIFAYTVAPSAGVRNLLVVDETLSTLFSDVSPDYRTVTPDVTWGGGAQRFVVAYARQGMLPSFPTASNQSRIRAALIDDPALGPVSTSLLMLPDFNSAFLAISQDWRPSLSGSGTNSSLVHLSAQSHDEAAFTETFNQPFVRALILNASTGTVVQGPFDIAGPGASEPDDLPIWDDEGGAFLTAYRRVSGNTERIAIRQRGFNQPLGPEITLASRLLLFGTYGSPQVAGRDSEYMVTWNSDSGFVENMTAMRFRLPVGGTVQTQPTVTFQDRLGWSLDFDRVTSSHWLAAFTDESANEAGVIRFGFSGAASDEATDRGTMSSVVRRAGELCFDRSADDGSCLFHYGFRSLFTGNSFWEGRTYVYPAADVVPISASCSSGNTTTLQSPFRGNRSFRLGFENIGPNRPASPLVSLLPQTPPLSLDFIGFIGCELGVDLNVLVGFPSIVSDANGDGSIPIPIPEPIDFDFYAQWIHVDPAAPGLLRLTDAVRLEVR
jgi:hypothetical protein